MYVGMYVIEITSCCCWSAGKKYCVYYVSEHLKNCTQLICVSEQLNWIKMKLENEKQKLNGLNTNNLA